MDVPKKVFEEAKEVVLTGFTSPYKCLFCSEGIWTEGAKVMDTHWWDDNGCLKGHYSHKKCFTAVAVASKLKG